MKRLSNLRLRRAPAADEARLEAWLREWEIAIQLEADAEQDEPVSLNPDRTSSESGPSVLPYDPDIHPAQVRLLAPALGPITHTRPFHVIVLESPEGNRVRVTPVSRFETPALPGELAIETGAPGLSVVCLWNAFQLPLDALCSSWVISRLSDQMFRDCLALDQALQQGVPPPKGLANRIGPPLTHPLDPRHHYQDTETAQIRSLQTSLDDATHAATPLIYPSRNHTTSLPKAAEDHTDYTTDQADDDPLIR